MDIKALIANPGIFGNFAITDSTPPPPPRAHWRTALTRLSLWPLALLAAAMIVVCEPLQAQTNTAATGAPEVTAADSTDLTMVGPNEDSVLTATQGTIMDADGITTFTATWAWHEGDTADGDFTAIAGAAAATFTPLQAHVGKFIRACATFDDDDSNEEIRCWTSVAAVVNVNDAPVGLSNTIYVPAGGSYTFSVDDFPFIDEDGDLLVIAGVGSPSKGTFTFNGNPRSDSNIDFTAARLTAGAFGYTPPAEAGAMAGYATFNWVPTTKDITAGNLGGSVLATITIDLVPTTASAATGVPTVTAATGTAYNEDVELTAAIGTVADTNGIPTHTRSWQWQSAPAPASGTPAASAYGPIAGATDATFTPLQAHVRQYIHACLRFTDGINTAEMRCSAGTIITNVNDAPVAAENPPAYTATNMPGITDTVVIHPAAFQAAYSDPDGDIDMLAAVNITVPPPAADGILSFGGTPVTATAMAPQTLTINGDEFMGGTLTFTPASRDTESTTIGFTLTDNGTPPLTSNATTTVTINIQLGQDIDPGEVVAVFNAAAVAGATDAIMGAMGATANDLSLDGTSLAGAARTLGQSTIAADGHAAWFHGTTAGWEYQAAYNADDGSADNLQSRLQSMANGDIAMNYQAGGSAMRFWARYQSIDISGNEDEGLKYDGSGTGFYLGADRRINDRMRLGLAISSDSADMTLRLDADGMDDEASRSATTVYPYMQMDLGNNNHLRVIAGIGSGDLDIKSSINNSTASAGLSWNMLAASISHHRPMKGRLSARFDGSLQLGNSSTDDTTFANGSTLSAADASTNEIAVNAELRYKNNNFTPFASLSGRKLGGDLSQSLAMDLGLGADLQTNPAIIRLSITRQLNDTTHKRDSLSLDIATRPNRRGITASLGSNYDSLSGRPQWHSRLQWQHRNLQSSLQASPDDWRLQARVRW